MQPDTSLDSSTRLEPERHADHHGELEHWRSNVGSPIAIDAGPMAAPRLSGIDVLSWNIAIGQGRLGDVLERLRAIPGDAIGTTPERPLIILAQEVYREDETGPGAPSSIHQGGTLKSRQRLNVIELAERSELSVR